MLKNLFKNENFIVILIAFLIILLSRIIEGDPMEKFSIKSIILVLLVFLSVYTINNLIIALSIGKKNSELLRNLENKISSTIEAHGFPWLLRQKEIDRIELTLKEMDIWIVTPDLHNDTCEPDIIDVVKKNIERGINYTYVVPNNPLIESRLKQLENIFKGYPKKLNYILVEPMTYHLTANLCYAIYNPKSIDGKRSKVYVEIHQPNKIENKLWVELPQEDADTFVGTISNLIRKYNNKMANK